VEVYNGTFMLLLPLYWKQIWEEQTLIRRHRRETATS